MAKFELKFLDFINEDHFIKVSSDLKNSCITIYTQSEESCCFIFLDKSTAIKFAKTLRTEINKINENE